MKTEALPPQDRDSKRRAHLRILATSDLHMHLTSYDYYADCPDPNVGFTRTANAISAAREQAARNKSLVLLFDNGDSLQGTPFGDWAAETVPNAHPLPKAFNALGYDAIGLGNHDFGFGLDFINRVTHQLTCPTICSNMKSKTPDQGWVSHAILQRSITTGREDVAIRIGVLSVLPTQTARWEAHMLKDAVQMTDILNAAQDAVTTLHQAGCDLIVALAHTGLGMAKAEPEMENAIIPLAASPGIDAIVAGHTHLTLPGKAHAGLAHVDSDRGLVHGKPVVMPGWAGSHLGVIDLTLERDGNKAWQIVEREVEARAVNQMNPSVTNCPEMTRLFAEGHTATRARVARPVGTISHSLHSYFSFCAPDRGLALVAAAQAAVLRPHLLDSEWADYPVLSAAAPTKFGGRAGIRYYTDVPAGNISVRNVADLCVFPNELHAALITSAQVRDWLEMSAGLFNQLSADNPEHLIDPVRAGHNFDVLHGVTCRFDLSQPARFDATGREVDPNNSRVRDLTFDGQPVTPNQRFVVAVNNYRASGGGHFPIDFQANRIDLPTLRIHDILCNYIAGTLPRDPLEHAPRPFSFAPTQNSGAILTTGPGAEKYLDELTVYAPRMLPRDADGFLRVHLSF
ncbi:bifunctional 2',3'-cyclic-nucleotide 2'-phosphodiesterase/3'-nucleotidase [uncultured Ruegeria sp.]|uniref:bifunctional 2',3'-cyclic-nucleotide 2'-phosphodiesterase/3'-nucleotidase n=1 Tax=uncultured Ruegeria sp. TaxID=259304 RepID=UPI002638FAF6|nr:bifunctional 2',3'-cyclic-nucleotide 2'-phosphodiesterase/3'-nucleotidase [uncultured Ruegeria sp.]